MMKRWGMQSAFSLPSLLGLLVLEMVAHDRVLSIGQTKVFGIQTDGKQKTYAKLNCLK